MDKLIEYFFAHKDAKGIPTLNKEEWKELNKQYDKETIIAALIEYIRKYKPEPPVCNVSELDMKNTFLRLRKISADKFLLPDLDIRNKILEKYDDYGKPYKDYGLGVIQMGNAYIDVSNYFNQTLRMNCDTYGFKSAHHRWRNCEDLRTVFLALWRLGNDKLCEYSFVVAFRLATYIATQFKPHVAKTVYDMVGAKVVFDSSCGWGDRLAGFYCSNAKEYYGCDPNEEAFAMYVKQIESYEKMLGNTIRIDVQDEVISVKGQKTVHIWRKPAEDLDYSKLPKIDCAFTSPPYFSTELYNSNGKNVKDQSWKRYDTYEKWRDNFYLPVNRKTFKRLAKGGVQIVNIMDPKVKNKRYYASDDLIKDLTTKYQDCSFIGQLGMRIMQRPKNVSKEKIIDHFDKIYIEPMWVFGKSRNYLLKESKDLLSFI